MSYGCPATVDGNPIGGKAYAGSYSGLVTPDYCDEIVTTLSQYKSATAKPGRKIWLGADIELLTTGYAHANDLLIAGDLTHKLYYHIMTEKWKSVLNLGARNHFLGVVVEGPDPTVGTNSQAPVVSGLGCGQAGCVIESCELRNWTSSAVACYAPGTTQVIFNYLHHNQRLGMGYGVGVWGQDAYAEIMANAFDYSRHHVAAGSSDVDATSRDSYDVYYNLFGRSTHTQVDHHGGYYNTSPPAGVLLRIHHNTFTYTGQRAVGIRGYPVTGAYIFKNWTYASRDYWQEYAQETLSTSPSSGTANPIQVKMFGETAALTPADNWKGTALPPSDLRKMAVTVSVARR